jgi:hypothetical protein
MGGVADSGILREKSIGVPRVVHIMPWCTLSLLCMYKCKQKQHSSLHYILTLAHTVGRTASQRGKLNTNPDPDEFGKFEDPRLGPRKLSNSSFNFVCYNNGHPLLVPPPENKYKNTPPSLSTLSILQFLAMESRQY